MGAKHSSGVSSSNASMSHQFVPLIGGSQPWNASLWTTSDDSIRGGGSHSSLALSADSSTAVFSGWVTTTNLTGEPAGFASQRTVGSLDWDVSGYDGMFVGVIANGSDDKVYTLTVKDTLPVPDNGTNLLYEKNFTLSAAANVSDGARSQSVLLANAPGVVGPGGATATSILAFMVPWQELVPTYQGKTQSGSPPLNTKDVKRISIMFRSYFGMQQGNFSLVLDSFGAYKNVGLSKEEQKAQEEAEKAATEAKKKQEQTDEARKKVEQQTDPKKSTTPPAGAAPPAT